MSRGISRFLAAAMLVVSTVSMVTVTTDAEARRFGGGRSLGSQSGNVMKQRPAVQPPAASSNAQRSATAPANSAAAGAAANTASRSGMSRFLGPIAGIAAGLGLAALLSHLGLSGAFLEMMSSLLLIALVVFAVVFLVRRLRRGSMTPAHQNAGAQGTTFSRDNWQNQNQHRDAGGAARYDAGAGVASSAPAAQTEPVASSEPQQEVDKSWFIPADFDTPAFLANAKEQFRTIQALWDSGDVDKLGEYLTDDLIAEFKPQILAREGRPQKTEVLLLNAELLGIEQVAGGYLASVRYSGMLRESENPEAFRFEEVWNLYKADNAGWLLAGIQQLPGASAQ